METTRNFPPEVEALYQRSRKLNKQFDVFAVICGIGAIITAVTLLVPVTIVFLIVLEIGYHVYAPRHTKLCREANVLAERYKIYASEMVQSATFGHLRRW